MSRINAYIDGSLFLNGTRGQGMSMDMDLLGLVKSLVPGDEIGTIYYFGALSPQGVYPDRHDHDKLIAERFALQGAVTRLFPVEVRAHITFPKGIEAALSTQMVLDAATDAFDTALVISKRAELADPIQAVKKLGKSVTVIFYEYEVDPGNPLAGCADTYAALPATMVIEHRKGGPWPIFPY